MGDITFYLGHFQADIITCIEGDPCYDLERGHNFIQYESPANIQYESMIQTKEEREAEFDFLVWGDYDTFMEQFNQPKPTHIL